MVNLEREYEQIILACKGYSIIYSHGDVYASVKNTIENLLDSLIDDHLMLYWLIATMRIIDKTIKCNFEKLIVDTLFSKNIAFPRCTISDNITVQQMNMKIISLIAYQMPVKNNDGADIFELTEDADILNTIYKDKLNKL